MKPITLTFAVLTMFSSLFAQVSIDMPPCDDEKMKELQNQAMKQLKGSKKSSDKEFFPQDLYKEKVVVFIANRGFENIESTVRNKRKTGSTYSFEPTIAAVKEVCNKAGLNVMKYHIIVNDETHLGKYSYYGSAANEKQQNEYFESGAAYILEVQQVEGDDEYRLYVYNKGQENIYTSNLEKLSESSYANSSNYSEGEIENELNPEAVFGGKYEIPRNIKSSTIYYVNAANINMPNQKPKTLTCKGYFDMYGAVNDQNKERNQVASELLPTCDVKSEIVDESALVPVDENSYILKYYEVNFPISTSEVNGQMLYSKTECLYLENTLTKRVYALEGESNSFKKYMKKAIKSINEY